MILHMPTSRRFRLVTDNIGMGRSEFMERADRYLIRDDRDRFRYWTERANKEVAKAKLPFRWA
jgi:hypothetical protein